MIDLKKVTYWKKVFFSSYQLPSKKKQKLNIEWLQNQINWEEK